MSSLFTRASCVSVQQTLRNTPNCRLWEPYPISMPMVSPRDLIRCARSLLNLSSVNTYDGPCDPFQTAAGWLRRCVENHLACGHTGSDQMPTRLVQIDSKTVRVVLTADLGSKPLYATLSHCWGTKDFSKLQTNRRSSPTSAEIIQLITTLSSISDLDVPPHHQISQPTCKSTSKETFCIDKHFQQQDA